MLLCSEEDKFESPAFSYFKTALFNILCKLSYHRINKNNMLISLMEFKYECEIHGHAYEQLSQCANVLSLGVK